MAKNQNTIKWLVIIVVSALSLAFFVGLVINGKNRNKPQTVDGKVQLSDKGHVRMGQPSKEKAATSSANNNNPRITLVEFGDLQCPACKAYHPVVKEVLNYYAGDIKLIFKHFPLIAAHPNAMSAAIAAEAAGEQGKFFEMVDLLYDKQLEWSGQPNPDDKFESYAKSLGLDVSKFKKDLSRNDLENRIEEERNEGIRNGIQATPTFFLNGEKLDNPSDIEGFKKEIDELLKSQGEVPTNGGISPTVSTKKELELQ